MTAATLDKTEPATVEQQHAHHAGCLLCNLAYSFPTRGTARGWITSHMRKVHKITDQLPEVIEDNDCPVCNQVLAPVKAQA